MDPEGSVTRWISLLKDGDRAAASPLWEAYFHRLVALARDRLRGTPRRAADEEDVALAAFDSFYRRAERGQFPKLQDRDDLWRLLFVLTVRKAIDLARREARQPGRAALGPVALGAGRAERRAAPQHGAHPRVRRPGGRRVPATARPPGG